MLPLSRSRQLNPISGTSYSLFHSRKNESDTCVPSTPSPLLSDFHPESKIIIERVSRIEKMKLHNLKSRNGTTVKTLINISNGASNIDSTSPGFGAGSNAFFSLSMPITGTTLRRCCTKKRMLDEPPNEKLTHAYNLSHVTQSSYLLYANLTPEL